MNTELEQVIENINNMSLMSVSELAEKVFEIVIKYDEMTNDEEEALETLCVEYVEKENVHV